MKIEATNIDSLLITFSEKLNEEDSKILKKYYRSLKEKNIDGITQIIPSYTTILISYDILKYDFKRLKEVLLNIDISEVHEDESNIIEIQTYYGLDVGEDLQRVAKLNNITIKEVIDIHSSTIYDVHAIGFLPGFAYLANVDKSIIIPRLETPRKAVPKGSVAIADNQSAVYPMQSPGGWNIIGKTTFDFYDKSLDKLCPVNVGDKIKFTSITKEEFLNLGGEL